MSNRIIKYHSCKSRNLNVTEIQRNQYRFPLKACGNDTYGGLTFCTIALRQGPVNMNK